MTNPNAINDEAPMTKLASIALTGFIGHWDFVIGFHFPFCTRTLTVYFPGNWFSA